MQTRRHFRFLQTALFAATQAVSAADADDVPWVSRHAVLRRQLQGQPAFVVGALGNVGMSNDNNENDENTRQVFAQALADCALAFFQGQLDNDFFDPSRVNNASTRKNIMQQHASTVHETLHWTGEMHSTPDGASHARFQQYFDNFVVQGGNIVVHADAVGNVVAANGEYVDCRHALSSWYQQSFPLASPAEDALSVALTSLGLQPDFDLISQTRPELALVVSDNFSCCLAYQSNVTYWDMDTESGNRIRKEDIFYLDAFDGDLCAREPLVFGAFSAPPPERSSSNWLHANPTLRRSLSNNMTINDDVAGEDDEELSSPEAQIATYYCVPSTEDTEMPPKTGDCVLASDSPIPIATGNVAIDSAHNYALATFNYFWFFHGLNSLNGQGYELISYVLSDEFQLANAYWNGFQMTYGNGSDRFKPLSEAADVVAHELTHGVTQFSSRLIYRNESGALNEAMSDIFGALIERQVGTRGQNVWLIGEDVMRNGGAIRYMGDPSRKGHFDYYPSRYQGESDNGGVHWNSGIANLAFKMLVTGGRHPRGATDVNVMGLIEIFNHDEDLAFAVAGRVFYCANSECLTRHSTFDDARHCTATICGSFGIPEDPLVVNSIHAAWYAVGVGDIPPLLPSGSPTSMPIRVPTSTLVDEPIRGTPSGGSTARPSKMLSPLPSISPSPPLSQQQTAWPTAQPTFHPTSTPIERQSASPTFQPSPFPSRNPSRQPTVSPTRTPSNSPTEAPILSPTKVPTLFPTEKPTWTPTMTPIAFPSKLPTARPATDLPSIKPSVLPSSIPTQWPTKLPFISPTTSPSENHSSFPTAVHAMVLSFSPESIKPTASSAPIPKEAPSLNPSRLTSESGSATQDKSTAYPSKDSSSASSTIQPTLELEIEATEEPSQAQTNLFDKLYTEAPTHTLENSPAPTLGSTPAPTVAQSLHLPTEVMATIEPPLASTIPNKNQPSNFASANSSPPVPLSISPSTAAQLEATADSQSRVPDESKNKTIPWVWLSICSVMASLAMGLAIVLWKQLQKQ